MGRATYRSILISRPNEWHAHEGGTTWEYGNYRHLYLCIRKLENGKYKPSVGAQNDIDYPGHDLPACGYFQYDTLEEAKKHLYEYTDYIRDVWDDENRKAHYRNLHRANPNVYPAFQG